MTSIVRAWLESRNFQVKAEFSLPWGICDLVGVQLRPDAVRKRLSLGQKRSIGPASSLRLLSLIPDAETAHSVSLEQLEAELGGVYSHKFIASEIDRLERNRFLFSPTQGKYQKLNGWAPLHSCLVAVELKLTRVTDAIHQATANQSFAVQSYIALPEETASRWLRRENNGRLEKSGLGLLAVRPDSCAVIVQPGNSRRYHDSILESHCIERFWRTRGNLASTA